MQGSLIDSFNRSIDYMRVSITDLCNLRCKYCRPSEGVKLVSHDDILRYEEILTIVRLARDMGVRKVRVTGGEPLVRRGVLRFLGRLAALDGIEDVGLTTNGVLLADMASDLKACGLTRINISLDSLRRDVFTAITGFDRIDAVMAGIHAALAAGFSPVKINAVLLAGFNEEDIPGFARLTLEYPVDVRFIERMPFGADHMAVRHASFTAAQALDIIADQVGPLEPLEHSRLDGPATLYTLAGALGRIGVIDPVTGHFCATCNRLRLTAKGKLRPCLLSPNEIDVKAALRRGASRAELAKIIQTAVHAKPGGRAEPGAAEGMNLIGG